MTIIEREIVCLDRRFEPSSGSCSVLAFGISGGENIWSAASVCKVPIYDTCRFYIVQHIFFCPASSSVYACQGQPYNGMNGLQYLLQTEIRIRVDIGTLKGHQTYCYTVESR